MKLTVRHFHQHSGNVRISSTASTVCALSTALSAAEGARSSGECYQSCQVISGWYSLTYLAFSSLSASTSAIHPPPPPNSNTHTCQHAPKAYLLRMVMTDSKYAIQMAQNTIAVHQVFSSHTGSLRLCKMCWLKWKQLLLSAEQLFPLHR